MKILVTGGAGYIGSVVVEVLIEQGYAVVSLDNLQAGHRAAVHPESIFVQVDLKDPQALDQVFGKNNFAAVIHLAGEALIAESVTDPRRFFLNNVCYGVNLLEAMLNHRVNNLIFSCTAAVYGEPAQVPILEDASLSPVNPYGESKLMFEKILHRYHHAYGLKYISLRYFNAAGATDRYGEYHVPETHLIPLALQVALKQREYVQIYGTDYQTPDGTCLRDYIHVLDLARAHVVALENLDRVGRRIYNLGNGEGYSVLQVIQCSREVTGKPIPAVSSPRRLGDPARLVASADRIRAELGWTPRYPGLADIIESAWRWHQAHPQGYTA